MKQTPSNTRLKQLLQQLHAGNLEEARTLGIQLVKAFPKHTQSLKLLGTIHGQLGDFAQAEACYRELLLLEPDSIEHRYYLGMALVMQGRLIDAVAPLAEMLRLQPDFAIGHMQMGCLLRDIGHHDDAIQHFEHALKLAPDLADAAVFLANLLIFRGQLDPALRWLDHALMQRPDHPEALAAKSLLLEKCGKNAESWACIQQVVGKQTTSPGSAIAFAKLAPAHGQSDLAQTLLKRALTESTLPPSQRQELHFALAQLCDKERDFDTAFENFKLANELYGHEYAPASLQEKARAIGSFFSGTAIQPIRGGESKRPGLIFIVGMPRSGTSLVEQMLACHPDVFAGGELTNLPELEHDLPNLLGTTEPYPECLRKATTSQLETIACRYNETMGKLNQRHRYITDKLPGNYERLGIIALLFPNARIIHIKRDARDTCLSCYFQNFGNTNTYSTNLGALGQAYTIYEKLMSLWREILPIEFLDIHYESIISDPEISVRKILAFCDLPFSAQCLNFHKSGRYINTASYSQVRLPIYSYSIGRWKNYETHIGSLINALSHQ